MPRARLIDLEHYRAERQARRTIRHLRRLAAQVGRVGDARWMGRRDRRMLHALLSNGAWAVEELYGWHEKEDL